jgi:gamma-glutamylcyclotransferase (GGCT)/AIG2-like uncharacterized protein YtfP
VFFYATLMAGFDRRRRAGIDDRSVTSGAARSTGAFDWFTPRSFRRPRACLGSRCTEDVRPGDGAAALDDIEGYRHDDPDRSLYTRARTEGHCPMRRSAQAWVYFYNRRWGMPLALRPATISTRQVR